MTDDHTAVDRSSTRRIRVLCVEMNEDGTTGGSHVVMRDLARGLKPPFEPVALFYQDNPVAAALRDEGIQVVTWDAIRSSEVNAMRSASTFGKCVALASQIRRRRAFIRSQRIDLIHLGNSPFAGCDDWLPAAKLARRPCVVYSMGAANGGDGVRRRLIRNYDRILPNSDYLRASLRRVGVPPEQLVLAYPGLDLASLRSRVTRPRDEIRSDWGLNPDQLLLVMVGNIREWKGQHLVIEAVAALPSRVRSAVRLLLVGATAADDASYERRLRSLIDEAGLAATVTLTGHRTDVPDLFHAADVAVHASIRPEPFGLVVLEAMAHKCAVIAAAEGGPGEMLDDESGILVDTTSSAQLREGLERLITDPSLRVRLAEAGAHRAHRFSLAEHLHIVTAVYREVLGSP